MDRMKENFSLGSSRKPAEKAVNPLTRQILASIGPILIIALGGIVGGITTIFTDQIDEHTTPVSMNSEQGSWIAAVPPIFMALGCFYGGWAMERLGRQNANILSTVYLMAGWVLIYFADGFPLLMAGRVITGFAVGATTIVPSIYLGEVVEPRHRQYFIAVFNSGLATGLFASHALGGYLGWRLLALVAMISPVVCVALFFVIPESHVWYIKRNELRKAQASFYWYRGRGDKAQEELDRLLKDASMQPETHNSLGELMRKCCDYQFLKPLLVMSVFFFTLQFSGNNAVIFHSINIVIRTVPALDKYSAVLIIDAVRTVMSVLGCILSKRFRVRPLTFISGYGACGSLLFVALFSYLLALHPDNLVIPYMPLLGLVAFTGFINIGFRALAAVLSAELFHPDTKGLGGGFTTGLNFLLFFLVVKINPDMMGSMGATGTFAVYALCLFVGTSVLFFILPETKNKSLNEIQEIFKRTS